LFPKRTVSVYSETPSPNRNPQFLQNRSSDGIAERQFEQVVSVGVLCDGIWTSGFCDIGESPFATFVEGYTTFRIRQMLRVGCNS
jgi:hypothetical protein